MGPVVREDQFSFDGVRELSLIISDQIYHDWVLHLTLCDLLNISWNRGRKYHLLRLRLILLQIGNVSIEAHVEHFVSLVEDLVF